MKSVNIGYDLSEGPTKKRLDIAKIDDDKTPRLKFVKEYFHALAELFRNDTANWILCASGLRTFQGLAL